MMQVTQGQSNVESPPHVDFSHPQVTLEDQKLAPFAELRNYKRSERLDKESGAYYYQMWMGPTNQLGGAPKHFLTAILCWHLVSIPVVVLWNAEVKMASDQQKAQVVVWFAKHELTFSVQRKPRGWEFQEMAECEFGHVALYLI
ncbi:unnamed protein product [Darwinula stevensoni]|uniref:Uncharacterized protein n=1 Tax=Darwinula stevensoni TaxID=69355 RepID=A0A7R8XHX3_9CRUS|nr:unnamed protein product [Darwinula stevensoni]CAG0893276.1 unnamed protein product [Darwinula stevensoni]